jgi:hypothetical protein
MGKPSLRNLKKEAKKMKINVNGTDAVLFYACINDFLIIIVSLQSMVPETVTSR